MYILPTQDILLNLSIFSVIILIPSLLIGSSFGGIVAVALITLAVRRFHKTLD